MYLEHIENKESKALLIQILSLLTISKEEEVEKPFDEFNIGSYKNYLSKDDFESILAIGTRLNLSKNDVQLNLYLICKKIDEYAKNAIFLYKDEAEYKQKMIDRILQKGIDKLSITSELFEKESIFILFEKEIKKSIIEKALSEIEFFNNDISDFDKKIIVFNLFKYIYKKELLGVNQFDLIKKACNKLAFDNEYLEDFNLLSKKYALIYKEFRELINKGDK